VNHRTALGMAGVAAVAVALGVVAGPGLAGSPVDGSSRAAPAGAITPTATPGATPGPVLVTVSDTTTPAPTPTPTGTPDGTVSEAAVEYLVHRQVNDLRAERGYDRLPMNASLREVARDRGERAAGEATTDHEGLHGASLDDSLGRFGVDCESSVETVGRVTVGVPVEDLDGRTVTRETVAETARAVVDRWRARATPRNGVLRPEWTAAAVGVHAVEAETGTVVYATGVFCEALEA